MSGLTIKRRGYALGAAITGIDLKQRLDAGTVARLREAWLEHTVLCFPDQNLDAQEFTEFCGRFGELDDNRLVTYLRHPEHESIFVMVNKPVTVHGKSYTGNVTDHWHSDFSHTARRLTGAFLNAKVLPDVGGDTM